MTATHSMTTHLPATLMASPALYPFQLDWEAGRAFLLETTPDWYAAAAFLDQRALPEAPKGTWVEMPALERAVTDTPDRSLGLIFHIGHCGSTLISRALGLIPAFFSLREPLPFRDLAVRMAETGRLPAEAGTLRALWARTPTPDMLSIVKATSFCSLTAAAWLAANGDDRAVMLAMAPEIYIATVLGAEAYVADLRGGAAPRMAALARATGASLPALETLTPGEVAAMTYMAEMVNLHLGAEAGGPRALRLDFDGYLRDPAGTLIALARHYGHALTAGDAATLLRHPILGRYSKATGYAFTARDRRDRLADSRAMNGAEITRGIDWIRTFARTHAVARDALVAYGYAR